MHRLSGIPLSGRLAFKALRNGSTLGTHHLTFSRQGDAMTVAIAVDYLVKIGFIPVFRYKLRCRESWHRGVLMSALAKCDDNGKAAWMRAEREGDALMVQGSKSGSYRAPAGAILASHWNQAQFAAPMINPQDGSLLRFTVAPRGPARIADINGKLIAAKRFALTGKDRLDLWYDAEDVWASLQAAAPDGSTISYLRIG